MGPILTVKYSGFCRYPWIGCKTPLRCTRDYSDVNDFKKHLVEEISCIGKLKDMHFIVAIRNPEYTKQILRVIYEKKWALGDCLVDLGFCEYDSECYLLSTLLEKQSEVKVVRNGQHY